MRKAGAYEAHTACDKRGFVLKTAVTPGNVHDSAAFDAVYDEETERFPEAKVVAADAAYKTPPIRKKVFEDGRVLSAACKRPQSVKGGHECWKYVWDEFCGRVICPEYQLPKYRTTGRDGYREDKSAPPNMRRLPSQRAMRPFQRLYQNGAAAYLEGVRRTGGRCQIYAGAP